MPATNPSKIKIIITGVAILLAIFFVVNHYLNKPEKGEVRGETTEIQEITKQEKKIEEIPFQIKYIDDPNLDRGKTQIKQDGKNGLKEITFEVVYKDGSEISRKIINEQITVYPQDQIIARGTRSPPPPGCCESGGSAVCYDGWCSYSAHRRGTCSFHGGVYEWCY